MNSGNYQEEDLLRKYIDPQRIEKAPEGFTHNVMTRIQLETEPAGSAGKAWSWKLIPVISALITLAFILAVLLLPGSASPAIWDLKFLQKIHLPELKVNLFSSFDVNVPDLVFYLLGGLLLLAIFDTGLNRLFHRKKM